MKEKAALVLFTLLAQTGIGLAMAAQLFQPGGELVQAADLGALLLTALGLLVASSHLGTPLGAYRALVNLRTSWLSRECLFLGSFLAFGLMRVFLVPRSGPAGSAAGWAWILVGGLSLFSMASLYGRTAIPAWKALPTHISFHTAALALGALTLAALAGMTTAAGWVVPVLFLGTGAAAVQILASITQRKALGTGGAAAQASLRLLTGPPWTVGLILTVLGGLAFPAVALTAAGSGAGNLWLVLAVAFLGAGQILVRYAYYTSGVHVMAAGWADIAYHPARRTVSAQRASRPWED